MDKMENVWMVVKRGYNFSVIRNDDPMFQYCSRTASERLEDGRFEIVFSSLFKHQYIIKYVDLTKEICEIKLKAIAKDEAAEDMESMNYDMLDKELLQQGLY